MYVIGLVPSKDTKYEKSNLSKLINILERTLQIVL